MNLRLHNNYYSLFKKRNKTIKKGLFKIQKPPAHKEFRASHLVVFLSFLFGAMGSANAQTIRYVKSGATGTGTSSWANASGDLQATINSSLAGDQVWVVAGTYLPNRRADALTVITPNDRNNAFVLKANVKIYGGFSGTETSLTQRDSSRATNNTILSGDIGTVGDNSDNAYHVVISAGDVGSAELNGFTISSGNANGNAPNITVNSQTFSIYNGGGIFNTASAPILTNISVSGNSADEDGGIFNIYSSPILTNSIISGNTTTYNGGGISNLNSSPMISNVIISGNTSSFGNGGGISNLNSSPVLTNVIISGNTANFSNGGGISNVSSSPVLTNLIISGNIAGSIGGGIYNYSSSSPIIRNTIIYGNNSNGDNSGIINSDGSSTPIITYSLIQGSTDVTNGNIDGNTDPKFISPVAAGLSTGGDYRLQAISPVINAGSNVYFDAGQTPDLSAVTTDLDGNPRIYDGTIDIGAYELQTIRAIIIKPDVNGIVYVTPSGNGNLSGSSWANAANDLQLSIDGTGVQQVWVAAGTYLPNRRADALTVITLNDRNNAFVLKANVKIYGGFTGTETSLTQRDSTRTTSNTILSGDIGTVGDNSDNAYHVVISAGNVGTAELNGFTISGGNANGNGQESIIVNSQSTFFYQGGGIYNESSSPILSNMNFSENGANFYGGGICNYQSSPLLTNVIISGNTTSQFGGGISNQNSSPVLTNVIISGNTAKAAGGIYNLSSSPVLTNVIISGNTSVAPGGGIQNQGSSPEIRNTIIYGNNSGIYNFDGSTPIISYSLVQDLTDVTNGNIDGSTDPKFVNPVAAGLSTGGDYRLQPNSPLINAGSNLYFDAGQTPDLSAVTTDLGGNQRIVGGVIDMGAYELQTIIIKPDDHGIVYVTTTGNGNLSGSSWANAANDLQLSIDGTGVQQVWVAAGMYLPNRRADALTVITPNDRNNAFVLKTNVKIYGGFTGTETSLTQRDSTRTTNNTILSGDIGTVGDNSDNAYHVVISAGDAGKTELNGFTVKGGNANASSSITVLSNVIGDDTGGGICNLSSSSILSNVTISENNAKYGSGIYNESSTPIFNNVSISGNNASYGGGGMYNYSSSPILNNVTINGNNAGSIGGGIFNYNLSPAVLTNVIISGNSSNNSGGGIYNWSSSPILTNVTISGNKATSAGGGIFNFSYSSPKIRNTIIYGNSNEIDNDGSTPIITYSLVQGSTDINNGNIDGSMDPKFVSPVAAGLSTGGNYRLQATSPAINAGSNTYFNAGQTPDLSSITTDLDGNPRIAGGKIDMGAYESQSTLPITLVNYTAQADGKQSKLQWETATEFNNREFTLLHATDGSHFTEIGKVAGAGNSKLQKDYVFYDANPANGINYYRLQQTDYDGRIIQLGIRSVNFSFLNGNTVSIYPNPVRNIVQVEFDANKYHQLELTDINGKVLQQLSLSNLDTQKKVDLGNLSSGIYFVKLVGNNEVESRKVVKE